MGYLVSKRDGQVLTKEQEAEKRKRTMARIGLATNVVGLAAGSQAMYSALRSPSLKSKKFNNAKMLAIGAAGLQGVNLAGDAIANRVLADSSKNKTAKPAVRQAPKPVRSVVAAKNYGGFVDEYYSPMERGTGHGMNLEMVEKEFRRFDPEADRQRRYGTYAGILGGTAIALGTQVPRNYTLDLKSGKDRVRGIAARPGRGRWALATTLGTAGAGAGAVHVYRRGVKERNNPWS